MTDASPDAWPQGRNKYVRVILPTLNQQGKKTVIKDGVPPFQLEHGWISLKKQKVTSSLQQNQDFVKVCFWAPRPSRLITRF